MFFQQAPAPTTVVVTQTPPVRTAPTTVLVVPEGRTVVRPGRGEPASLPDEPIEAFRIGGQATVMSQQYNSGDDDDDSSNSNSYNSDSDDDSDSESSDYEVIDHPTLLNAIGQRFVLRDTAPIKAAIDRLRGSDWDTYLADIGHLLLQKRAH